MTEIVKVLLSSGGFVRIVDKLGSDLTVVNAARVSYGKEKEVFDDKDKKLLSYLADHNHQSPFRHAMVQMHVKASETVARQWYKHVVGSEYAFKDQPWNEISGRYVEYSPDHYLPAALKLQSTSSKQGSDGVHPQSDQLLKAFKGVQDHATYVYNLLLEAGVSKEQARMILPVTFFTEWYWTASLQAIHHFVKLRSDAHAQEEIREYAIVLDDIMKKLYPNAWSALTEK
jgi:thymidylate synthase (FAD)